MTNPSSNGADGVGTHSLINEFSCGRSQKYSGQRPYSKKESRRLQDLYFANNLKLLPRSEKVDVSPTVTKTLSVVAQKTSRRHPITSSSPMSLHKL
ncbi:unnamed protein product [Ceratitis capitata]|uniref:(Mediterranean fruit fly) hypothetical protein n=1 Tax=Ceratitis capitata TaxID=7213 RepID=A0A811V3V4_CERCA|nr:unnamed protein product [Ceratitis capitata]